MKTVNEKTNSSPTQCAYLLELLKNGGTITDLEAKLYHGIGRLSARICELRDMGYNISSREKKSVTQFGKTHYSEYFIAREQEA